MGKRKKCDQCAAMLINGVFCHETGCPNAAAERRKDKMRRKQGQ